MTDVEPFLRALVQEIDALERNVSSEARSASTSTARSWPHAAPHPDVPAGLLRDRVRDQSVDEHGAAGRSCRWRSSSGTRCAQHIEDAGAQVSLLEPVQGLARPGVHGQCGDDLSASGRCSRGSAIRSGRAKSRTTAAGSRSTASKCSTCRRTSASKGPATRSSAATRCSPATACAATRPATRQIGRMLGCRVIPVELVDPRYYHLDTCFCPLAPATAIWYPPAFDDYGQRAIRRARAESDRGRTGGSRALRLQRGRHRQRVITNTGCDQAARGARRARATSRSPRRSTNSSKPAAARSASRCGSTAKKRRRGRAVAPTAGCR